MLDPATVITRLGGVARGTQLQRHGISRKRLAQEVGTRRIQRVRAGVFAAPRTDAGIRTAAAHGGALTCGSALRLHGVWVLDDDALHVWLGENGRRHPHPGCACTVHNFRGRTRFSAVDVETALVHLHACGGDEAFFAAFESACNRGLLPRAARARIRLALPEGARWLVDLARGDAQSGLESLLRLRLHILGIQLECQVQIDGVGRVDFVLGGRLILEADGKENHDGLSKRHKDLVRDAAASRLGYETLHFDYAQIVYNWDTVQSAILAALARLRA
ncbi:endonuclease domain-containing protein [Microbacterium sp.]|uniref:endonuclease domain-containing protein n=1 Tax=Microbacterium sp. TaxID=51671 RepID=UPI0039E6A1CB